MGVSLLQKLDKSSASAGMPNLGYKADLNIKL